MITGFPDLGWATDPIGKLFSAIVDAVAALVTLLFTWLLSLTQVNFLNTSWLQTYDVALWLAMIAFALMWIMTGVALATRKINGRTAFNRMAVGSITFLVIAPFGPSIGAWLENLFSALTRGLLEWGVSSSAEDVATGWSQRISALDGSGAAAEQIIGIILLLCVIVALIGMLVVSIVIALLQYIGGALFPILLAFLVSSKHNSIAKKATAMMLVLMMALPLMVFALVVVMKITAGVDTQNGAVELVATGQTDMGKDIALMIEMFVGLGLAAMAPLAMASWAMKNLGADAGGDAGAADPAASAPIGQQTSQGAANSVGQSMSSGGSSPASGGSASGSADAGSAASAVGAGGGGAGASGAAAGAGAGAGGGAAAGAGAGAVGGPAGMAAGAAIGAGASKAGNAIEQAQQRVSSAAQQASQTAMTLSNIAGGDAGEVGE